MCREKELLHSNSTYIFYGIARLNESSGRAIVVTLASASASALVSASASEMDVLVKVFLCDGQCAAGELSCTRTGLVSMEILSAL